MKISPADWKRIRRLFADSFKSSLHFSVATVGQDGAPNIAPIASLLLDPRKPRGCYFEIFARQTRKNLELDSRVCVLAVNSHLGFWGRSLLRGQFSTWPAVRLYGRAASRRPATPEEIARWKKRTRFFRWTRGYASLWGKLEHVRDIEFERFEPVQLGATTARLWQGENLP
ncbi:MAG: pyridoxamine 5'-phosphate oxidase family protein [Bdellovibrionales bacterium]|nr:pyridoxamine 5'-phosphate oxidase family protein [Bdellovibrionales bacterium]